MAAPRPRPPALKLIEGRGNGRDSGGRKIPQDPGWTRLPPEPPEILTGVALEEWHRVAPELQRLQLTKPVDAASLAAYCLAFQRLCEAQRIIDSEGILGRNSQGRVRHPAVAVLEAASKDLRAWANEFGFTPSSENGVGKVEANDDGEDNPFI